MVILVYIQHTLALIGMHLYTSTQRHMHNSETNFLKGHLRDLKVMWVESELKLLFFIEAFLTVKKLILSQQVIDDMIVQLLAKIYELSRKTYKIMTLPEHSPIFDSK